MFLTMLLAALLFTPPLFAQAVDVLPAPQGAASTNDLPLSTEQRALLDQALSGNNLNEAEKIIAAAYEKNPKSATLLRTLASISFRNQNYWNAAIAYKKAEKIEPLDDASRFSLAMAYVVIDHRDWARPELETLVRSNAANPLYLYWVARLDYDAQRFSDAVEKLHKVIEIDPSFLRAYDNLGLSLEALGQHDEALAAYEKAIELNRKQPLPSPWPSLNLGTMLYRLGRADQAEPHLRDAVKDDPSFSKAQYQLGALLQTKGETGEALAHLLKAAELDPADPKPHYALARLYQRQGEDEKARVALEKFSELDQKQKSDKKRTR